MKPTPAPTAPSRPTPLVALPWHATARALLDAHRLVMLVGEPGSGKTTFALAAARARTGQEPEIFQGTPETEQAHLFGTYTLEGGATRFVDGPLPAALKDGRLLLVEEFSLVPLETRAALLALRGASSIRNPLNGERIAIPDDFRLLATSNPENRRCYRNGQIAQALYDDFLILEVPPPEETELRALIGARFAGVEPALVDDAFTLWRRYRDFSDRKDNKNGVRLGVRALTHFVELRRRGLGRAEATAVAFVHPYVIDAEAHEAAKLHASMGA
jgi:MoxR-like ATPase